MSENSADPMPMWDDGNHALLAEAIETLETAWKTGTTPQLTDFVPVGIAILEGVGPPGVAMLGSSCLPPGVQMGFSGGICRSAHDVVIPIGEWPGRMARTGSI